MPSTASMWTASLRGRTSRVEWASGRSAIFGLRKNGEEFPADAAISKLDVGGKVILTVTVRDITERKRVENEQRFLAEVGAVFAATLEYEDTLSNIAELVVRDLADMCIVDIVEEGGEIRRLKVVSRDSSKAWACDVLMQHPLDPKRSSSAPVGPRDEAAGPHREGDSGDASLHGSERGAPSGASCPRPKSLIAVPLLAHGKLLGVVGLVSTTSSRVYGPADVRFAEEIAGGRPSRSRTRGSIVRRSEPPRRATTCSASSPTISAIRSATILMQATLLRRREGEPERRSRRPAEAIERAATRMNRLIQDLLDVTRMEAGQLRRSSRPAYLPRRSSPIPWKPRGARRVGLPRASARCRAGRSPTSGRIATGSSRCSRT